MPRKGGRSKRRGGKSLLRPQPTLILTPSQAFEARMGQSNDSTVLRGKFFTQTTLGQATSTILNIYPNNLGPRASALGTLFSRYRVKSLLLKLSTAVISQSAVYTSIIGIDDDYSGESQPVTGTSGVLSLRSSASITSGQSQPEFIMWTPIDKTKWYYTYTPPSSGTGAVIADNRLIIPAAILGACTNNGVPVSVEVDYVLVFAGAEQ